MTNDRRRQEHKMRLINIHTMKMGEFYGSQIPQYLILSHTWGASEISYQDFQWLDNYDEEIAAGIIDELAPRQQHRVRGKARALREREGFKKVLDFAALARDQSSKLGNAAAYDSDSSSDSGGREPPNFIWVDTCCINKESSAELSEAINSMYIWYRECSSCVAYLSDVEGADTATGSQFAKSRWFTRGWTLQELLAPAHVTFYNKHWFPITDKVETCEDISTVTNISSRVVAGLDRTVLASVAERMSWAAGRQTTRVEDQAYCLMGLFNVNMPLLYGEGKDAFRRLQQHIITSGPDQSIFAWGFDQPPSPLALEIHTDILARSPKAFAHSGSISRLPVNKPQGPQLWSNLITNSSFRQTTVGLEITLLLADVPFGNSGLVHTYAILPLVGRHDFPVCLPVLDLACHDSENPNDRPWLVRPIHESPALLFPFPTDKWPFKVVPTPVILKFQDWWRSKGANMYGVEFQEWFCCDVDMSLDLNYLEMWSSSMLLHTANHVGGWQRRLRLCGSREFFAAADHPVFFRVRKLTAKPSPRDDVVVIMHLGLGPGIVRWAHVITWDSVQRHIPNDAPSVAAWFLARPEMATTQFWSVLPPWCDYAELLVQQDKQGVDWKGGKIEGMRAPSDGMNVKIGCPPRSGRSSRCD